MSLSEKDCLSYKVGGLLYVPATNKKIPLKIERGDFPCLTSLAFCLEDAIIDDALPEAEEALGESLRELGRIEGVRLPLIFIRVRTPEHLRRVSRLYAEYVDVVTGYILPKFDLANAEEYISLIREINLRGRGKTTYIMPIFESKMIADVGTRIGVLQKLKEALNVVKEFVLNVRVGGNDFSNLYGLRRAADQSIYDIGVIRDIFVDIINTFASDYVVSGPVWEYFGAERDGIWDQGLERELELDRINGFMGKTAIHPSQLPLIYESMKVKRSDYEDALSILNWNREALGVAKSGDGSRMNEVKCHGKWAYRTALLGEIYGIKEG